MNFISHFFFDRNLDDSLFVVGACTPDLVSVYNREAKLNERKVTRLLKDNELTPAQASFYQGVIRHFHIDKLFHSSEFFHQETNAISLKLREDFKGQDVQRGFFVAHIMLELVLDTILIKNDEELLVKFYKHFQAHSIDELKSLTEWVGGKSLPDYENFLGSFVNAQHLYKYKDIKYVIDVLKRILDRVGITEYTYLDSEEFGAFLEEYAKELTGRYPCILDEIDKGLFFLSENVR